MKKIIKTGLLVLFILPLFCYSQINSPYSRYGVGNLSSQGSISNRAMGGISAAMSDFAAMNTLNPATYGNLAYTNLDMGFEFTNNNLKSKSPVGNFKSNYAIFNYVSVGIPLLGGNKNALKKNTGWGMAIGLKPLSRINYKVSSIQRNAGDSLIYVYEGNGGVNQAFIGTGVKLKNFSVGFNTGYLFGEKDYSSRIEFINDTVSYYKGNYQTKSRFGGAFLDAGMQYEFKLKKGVFRVGAYSQLKANYNAKRDDIIETYDYDQTGAQVRLDSIFESKDQPGKVMMPSTYGVGIALETEHLMVGVDYEFGKWKDYKFFGQTDLVQDNWMLRAGAQYTPASVNSTGYFNFVKYRAGFSVGRDYIKADNNLPLYNISVGGAFPLRLRRSFYDNQYSVMNITFEYGSRGNSKNNITESMYKLSLGFSLSDIWFIRQKYQ
ncbi:MAG: hypothetical protein KIT66_07950 [Chitinophagaceae bacterium]|nr:hypothetical protein [Chitinophagaceae bacterium]MCZ2395371.1 hypothetical protein [Chitinophagales bacterium]